MQNPRLATLTAIAVAGALALTACGSDNNDTSTPAASGGADAAVSGTLNGEGSTAQGNAIEQAISTFGDSNSDATVNYNPTGSGAGIMQFNAGQVDFAGSDSPLSTMSVAGAAIEADAAKKRCGGNEAWDLPMVAGPIAVAYTLPGVDKVILTPTLIAQMMLGKITTWNDPAIAKENPGVTLPKLAIKVFFRSDESGTTQNFEKYLAAAAPDDWGKVLPAKSWPGKVGEGRAKSDGVSEGIKSTPGALGYVEWSFAKDNKLGIAEVDNGGGAVALTGETAGAAVTAAKPAGTGNDLRLTLDYTTKDPGTYPIVLVTYEIVCSKGLPADKTALLKAFLTSFSSSATQTSLESIGYAPLPAAIQSKVTTAINAIS